MLKATVTRDNHGTRLNPLNAVVFACIFQDEKKAGPAMLEFLNARLSTAFSRCADLGTCILWEDVYGRKG